MAAQKQYVVTAYVNRLGRRDTLSQRMSKARATAYKKRTLEELKDATPRYKWCKELKIEERSQ
jgi:hypothetical protein